VVFTQLRAEREQGGGAMSTVRIKHRQNEIVHRARPKPLLLSSNAKAKLPGPPDRR
jgi:hypothetical protein